MEESTTVLAVEDERDCRELYRLWFAGSFEVRTAPDGKAALDQLTDDIDVVVLDRDMPRMNGETVAREIRSQSIAPAVVMVSAKEPDFDLLELPIDAYLQKPVTREDVVSAVRRVDSWRSQDPQHRELLALAARRDAVKAVKRPSELDASPAFVRVKARLTEVQDVSTEPLTNAL